VPNKENAYASGNKLRKKRAKVESSKKEEAVD